MKKILLMMVFGLVILTSCKKEKDVVPAKDNTETIMGGGTDKKLPPSDGGY